ncbi:TPA: DUF2798 domain-containing protein [Vibrio vulnificus]|nr:DUF2798 domain-containing protein [Vibrio sp. 05-20-BW147]HAS6346410.1 DUF2798 domain-containing protein [Vibrio vulnificus]
MLQSARLTLLADWPSIWLQSFTIAWPCALLLNLTVLPQVRKMATWLASKVTSPQISA